MSRSVPAVWTALTMAVLMTAIPAVHAQAPGDFTTEPDKSMAKAHESFMKGEMNKAADQIHKASVYVHKEGDKVAADAKAGVKKAGDDLDQLGAEVKKGAVKSGDHLKKTFAHVDHELARAWHATADAATKAGKDSTDALKKAGAGVEGAAKWSGTQLKEGTQASVDGLKKVGTGVKAGAEDVGNWFKGIGDGIADFGEKLKSSY
jgi:hypothetical protein